MYNIEDLNKEIKKAYKVVKQMKQKLKDEGEKKEYRIKYFIHQTPEYKYWESLVNQRSIILINQRNKEMGI